MKIITGIILFFLILAPCQMPFAQPSRVAAGDTAPDFRLWGLKGENIALSDLNGKEIAVLVFWATWCPYCIEEIPELIKLQNKFEGKGVRILGIDINESKEKVTPITERHGINYAILMDVDGKVADSYGIYGIPTAVIVDRSGIVRFRGSRPREGFEVFLENLLNE